MSVIQLKDQGNKAFLSKDYDKAIELYSSAIKLDNFNPILYSNRAQCYLNLKKFQLAYNDCITGLNLPNNNNIQILIKLNFRKGMALKGLLKFKLAKESFETILKLDPLNNPAILEIKNLPQENNTDMDIDVDYINIPIEEVDKLPQDFINLLKSPIEKNHTIEPIKLKTTSSEVDKEINNLFGSKKSNEKSLISRNLKETKPSNDNDLLNEKSPMHFLTALKQLPDTKKINGYKYVLNLDATSYQVIFESGIDAEFLSFFLDAVNYVSNNNSIANWNTIVLNHLKQFSSFKRYNLTILMCDDNVKKSILHNVEQQYPDDLQNFKKYII